jgi:hypothetical protein
MNTRNELEDCLVRWASQHGGSLTMTPDGICAFTADDMTVQLTMDEEGESLLLAAKPIDEDLAQRPSVMRALLRHAHLGEDTGRCGVSLSESGKPAIWHWLSTASIDAVGLENRLNRFLAIAASTRQILLDALHSDRDTQDRATQDWPGLNSSVALRG